MFTYVCLGTSDPERAARFYDVVLGALGHRRCEAGADWEAAGWRGWGTYDRGGTTELALWLCPPFDGRPASVGNGTMVAFSAGSWKEVEQFHAQARLPRFRRVPAPGLRPQYTPDFYAAYVRDPDGNKLAAVCRGFTEPQ